MGSFTTLLALLSEEMYCTLLTRIITIFRKCQDLVNLYPNLAHVVLEMGSLTHPEVSVLIIVGVFLSQRMAIIVCLSFTEAERGNFTIPDSMHRQ